MAAEPVHALVPTSSDGSIFRADSFRHRAVSRAESDTAATTAAPAAVGGSSWMEPEPEPEAAPAPAAAEARDKRQGRMQRLHTQQPVADAPVAKSNLPDIRSEGAAPPAATIVHPTAEEARISEAFRAAGGALTRDGVKILLQQLGRFEAWVDSALAKICEENLKMSGHDPDATVDAAAFASWWSSGGSLGPADALDQQWDMYSSRVDRLSKSVAVLLEQMPEHLFESNRLGRAELTRTVAISSVATTELLGRPRFPMYVLNVPDLLAMDAPILPHEEMIKRGMLFEVVEQDDQLGNFVLYQTSSSGERGRARTYADDGNSGPDADTPARYSRNRFVAISHQWLRPSRDPAIAHPDSEDGVKLSALQHYLQQADHWRNFLWMDFISIPQSPDARDHQMLAINSIPTYFMYSTTMLVVTPTGHFDDTDRGYLSRGHCLLELATSRLPRIDMFGKWYIPGSEASGQWGSVVVLSSTTKEAERVDQFAKGTLAELAASSFRSPIAGNFTVEADRSLVRSLIQKYVQHHDFVEAQVLAPLRSCATFTEYARKELPDCLRLQTHRHFCEKEGGQSPSEWLESMLPAAHVAALRASLADD